VSCTLGNIFEREISLNLEFFIKTRQENSGRAFTTETGAFGKFSYFVPNNSGNPQQLLKMRKVLSLKH
jgi:hypothetical protein